MVQHKVYSSCHSLSKATSSDTELFENLSPSHCEIELERVWTSKGLAESSLLKAKTTLKQAIHKKRNLFNKKQFEKIGNIR